jgi:hypothetical protein
MIAALAATTALLAGSDARASEPADSRWSIGASFAAGLALTSRPEDQAGQVTLLYGTGFRGPGFRGVAYGRYRLHEHVLLQLELGAGRYRGNGYASRGEVRRDLDLKHTAVEVAALVHIPIGVLEAFVGLGIAPRIGVSSSIRDSASEQNPPDRAPLAATTNGFPLVAELGFAPRVQSLRFPIAFRAGWNVAYPARTVDRLVDWSSFDDRGRYLVEHDFDLLVLIGVDGAFAPRR